MNTTVNKANVAAVIPVVVALGVWIAQRFFKVTLTADDVNVISNGLVAIAGWVGVYFTSNREA